jgi:hypothetical protein
MSVEMQQECMNWRAVDRDVPAAVNKIILAIAVARTSTFIAAKTAKGTKYAKIF